MNNTTMSEVITLIIFLKTSLILFLLFKFEMVAIPILQMTLHLMGVIIKNPKDQKESQPLGKAFLLILL